MFMSNAEQIVKEESSTATEQTSTKPIIQSLVVKKQTDTTLKKKMTLSEKLVEKESELEELNEVFNSFQESIAMGNKKELKKSLIKKHDSDIDKILMLIKCVEGKLIHSTIKQCNFMKKTKDIILSSIYDNMKSLKNKIKKFKVNKEK